MSQTYLSPFGPQPAGNVGATDNRYTSAAYRVSPYIQGVLPGQISYLLRNDNIWSNLSNTPGNAPGFAGSYVSQWIGRLNSPIRTFGWTIDGNATYTKFTNEQALTNEIVRGILHYQPDPQLRLDAIGGYEWNDYFVTKSDNAVYGAGGEWRPSDRTTVAGDWQNRFFGSSYLALLTHRNPVYGLQHQRVAQHHHLSAAALSRCRPAATSPRWWTRRSRPESPTPSSARRRSRPFSRRPACPPTLQSPLNFYTQQVQLYEQQSATFTWLGVRNSLAFTVYNRKGEVISGGTGQPLPPPFGQQNNNTQRGAALVLQPPADAADQPERAGDPLRHHRDRALHRQDHHQHLPGLGRDPAVAEDRCVDRADVHDVRHERDVFNDYDVFTAFVGFNHRF